MGETATYRTGALPGYDFRLIPLDLHELHAEPGQCITAIQGDAETIRDLSGGTDKKVNASVEAILNVSAHLYDVVHCMIQRARPGGAR